MSERTTSQHCEFLLDSAEDALNHGDADAALGLCEQVLAIEAGHPGAEFVRGDALRLMGRLDEAVDAYRTAALARPEHASSWASLALTQFDLLDFNDAAGSVCRAIREEPRNPEGWWVRSLILEWRGDLVGARRSLAHAQWLDPNSFPLPPSLSDDDIEALVEEAIGRLSPSLRDYLSNVAVILEEVPDETILRQYDPPASPVELLGYFSGPSLMDRSSNDPWSQFPASIVLFRQNLQRHATNRAEVIEQLRITFFHEVGHFLGLNEVELEVRGLD